MDCCDTDLLIKKRCFPSLLLVRRLGGGKDNREKVRTANGTEYKLAECAKENDCGKEKQSYARNERAPAVTDIPIVHSTSATLPALSSTLDSLYPIAICTT